MAFLDPMFPAARRKSALPKRRMQWLREYLDSLGPARGPDGADAAGLAGGASEGEEGEEEGEEAGGARAAQGRARDVEPELELAMSGEARRSGRRGGKKGRGRERERRARGARGGAAAMDAAAESLAALLAAARGAARKVVVKRADDGAPRRAPRRAPARWCDGAAPEGHGFRSQGPRWGSLRTRSRPRKSCDSTCTSACRTPPRTRARTRTQARQPRTRRDARAGARPWLSVQSSQTPRGTPARRGRHCACPLPTRCRSVRRRGWAQQRCCEEAHRARLDVVEGCGARAAHARPARGGPPRRARPHGGRHGVQRKVLRPHAVHASDLLAPRASATRGRWLGAAPKAPRTKQHGCRKAGARLNEAGAEVLSEHAEGDVRARVAEHGAPALAAPRCREGREVARGAGEEPLGEDNAGAAREVAPDADVGAERSADEERLARVERLEQREQVVGHHKVVVPA